MNLKGIIAQIADTLGFQRMVVGGLEPMDAERAEFERWLAKGYAAGMEYLKRNPHFRTSPQLLFPGARSAIVVSASYYTEVPPSPGPGFGRVARYAVGLDYHAVLRAKLRELKAEVEKAIGRPFVAKPFTDDVALYEPGFAARAGLGFAGKNTLIIGPRLMGSYFFVAELFCDLELPPDEPYVGTCGRCFRCGDICPTDAIGQAGEIDAGLCISYLTIENKDGIPLALRKKVGDWLFGCDLCQEVCPYNQRPPSTPWREFQPQSGVGHHVELLGLLAIDSDAQFLRRFQHSPLRRPKRRGLLRNALIVLGNQRPAGAVEKIAAFALAEPDPMLREHAAWALAQFGSKESARALTRIYEREETDAVRQSIDAY